MVLSPQKALSIGSSDGILHSLSEGQDCMVVRVSAGETQTSISEMGPHWTFWQDWAVMEDRKDIERERKNNSL